MAKWGRALPTAARCRAGRHSTVSTVSNSEVPTFPHPLPGSTPVLFFQLCQYSSPVLWSGTWADPSKKENTFFLHFLQALLYLLLTPCFEGVVGSNVKAGIPQVVAQRGRYDKITSQKSFWGEWPQMALQYSLGRQVNISPVLSHLCSTGTPSSSNSVQISSEHMTMFLWK